MKIYTKAIALILAACLAAPAMAGARKVDCDTGDSLQTALESGEGSAAPIEIEVTGTCYGTFTMSRDRVTILGDGSSTIHGMLRIFGSQQVVIRDMIFTGPRFGLFVVNSRVRIFDTHIVDNDNSGVQARDNSVVRLAESQVTGNWEGVRINNSHLNLSDSSIDGNDTDGVLVLQNSSLSANGGSMSHNGVLGIRVYANSSINLNGTLVELNQYGIQMAMASSGDLNEVQVINNNEFGVELNNNSAMNIYSGQVGSNGVNGVKVNAHSFLTLNETSIEDPKGWNNHVSHETSTSQYTNLMLAGLLANDHVTLGIEPHLAKSYEISDDNLQITFYLRQGVALLPAGLVLHCGWL